jgi:hypothetical protein
MSLHDLANQVQSAGRNDDKVLVHMTPKEVGGLQSLAMAHGGSLTINPETGLPEAGFLSSILPMIAGFALGPAGFALMSAPMAGLAVGAATGLATGSLKQGLMAGLGAYGGAGLGQGLMAQGAQGTAGAAASSIDDVALASKNAAANSQIGAGYGGIQPQTTPLFGQPTVGAATTPNMGLSAYTPPAPVATPTYAQTQANMLKSPMFQATPPTPSVTTPLDAAGRRSITLTDTPIREAYGPLNPPPAPVMPQGATGYVFDPVKGGYNYYGPGGNPVMPPSAASGSVPIETRIPTPLNPVVRSEILPGDPALAQPQSITGPFRDRMSQVGRGLEASTTSFEGLKGLYTAMPQGSVIASGITLADAMKPKPIDVKKDKSLVRPYDFDYGATGAAAEPYSGSGERLYFNPTFTARTPYEAPGPEYAANGGLMGYQAGGQIERMAAQNAVGVNTGYPMASLQTPMYSNPETQRPEATNVIAPSADVGVGAYSGEPRFARGGISDLGDYSDGGRLLKGPGDGVSDSIPASIGNRQPARLADGEFVVPARIVSEIGNGSTEAGARKLYAMMDRVQKARRKTVGKGQVARNTKAEKLLPA